MVAKKDEMYRKIREHGENLIRIFQLASDTDPVKLCKKLHRLEAQAHRDTTRYCNGEIQSDDWYDGFAIVYLNKVDEILNFSKQKIPVFINADARGYALKIRSEYCHDKTIYRDMGGYGIIAPDFSDR